MSLSRTVVIATVLVLAAVLEAGGARGAEWTLTAPMQQPRWFHAAGAGSDGRVYVYGGYVRTPAGRRAFGIGENGLEIFDPASGSWSMGPAPCDLRQRVRLRVEVTRTSPQGSTLDGIEWRDRDNAGPPPHELFEGDQSPGGRPHWFSSAGSASVFFDPATWQWRSLPSPGLLADKPDWTMEDFKKHIPKRRREGTWPVYARTAASAATSADGKVYVIGGTGRRGGDEHAQDESGLLSAIDVYDAVENRWYEIAPLREARQFHAATFGRDGRLYVFGGVASAGGIGSRPGESDASWERRNALDIKAANTSLASVEIYDPKSETWTTGRPMPTPRQAMGAALGADGKIYVVGGTKAYSTPDPVDTVEIYDPATDRWAKGPSLVYPRRGHAVVATPDGKIYAIGGWAWSRKLRLPMSDARRYEEDGKDLRATVEVLDTNPAQ